MSYRDLSKEEQIKYLSKSKFKTFSQCPEYFRLKYIEGIKEPYNPAFDFGKKIHTLIEQYFAKVEIHGDQLIVPDLDYTSNMEPYVINFLTFELNRWKKILELKGNEAKKYYMPVLIEKEILTDKYIIIPDRIHLTLSNALSIVENKAGNSQSKWTLEYPDDLYIYKIMLKGIFDIKYGSIYYPKDNTVTKVEFDMTRLKELENNLDMVQKLIELRIFRPNPGEQCISCNFRKVCGYTL
jgi:CRISPR/Cas system-associated exonuclease Cas4 (RecB family)